MLAQRVQLVRRQRRWAALLMGRTEVLPPGCDYVCEWQGSVKIDQTRADSMAGTSQTADRWRLLELSDADGDVFDLSFVFDKNWWVEPGCLPSLTDAPPGPVLRRDCCAGILQHSFELHNVLSRPECDAIMTLSDAIGFQRPTCGGGIGSKEASPPPDRFVWVTDQGWCNRVYKRMEACLPTHITGRKPVGINPRWRLYRYEPGFALERHQDRSFKASGTDETGKLRYDLLRDGSESLLTLLIYLNEGMEGGGTMLFERDDMTSALQEVSPQPGAALLFPHGRDNPESVWHAGMPVTGGHKYIIRTDVIYGPPIATPQKHDERDEEDTSGAACSSEDGAAIDAACGSADFPQAAAAWDESVARAAFRKVDEYEMGWLDMAGVLNGLALCGYPTVERVHGGEQVRTSSKQVEELLGGMADEREDSDCLNVDEFCRLAHLVHEDTTCQ